MPRMSGQLALWYAVFQYHFCGHPSPKRVVNKRALVSNLLWQERGNVGPQEARILLLMTSNDDSGRYKTFDIFETSLDHVGNGIEWQFDNVLLPLPAAESSVESGRPRSTSQVVCRLVTGVSHYRHRTDRLSHFWLSKSGTKWQHIKKLFSTNNKFIVLTLGASIRRYTKERLCSRLEGGVNFDRGK